MTTFTRPSTPMPASPVHSPREPAMLTFIRRVTLLFAPAILAAAAACTSSSEGDSDGTDGTDGFTSFLSGTGGETTGTTGGVVQLGAARMIHVDAITIDQGVSVPVWTSEDGLLDASSLRNARLLGDRPFQVRASWAVGEGWEEREITVRLHVGGETMDQVVTIAGDPDPDDAQEHLQWSLPAELATEDATFQIELLEPAATAQGDVHDHVVAPPSEPKPVMFEDVEASLEVVLVPVQFSQVQPACETMAVPTPEDVESMTTHLVQLFPVQDVLVEVADETIETSDHLNPERNRYLDDLLAELLDYRVSQGLAPHVFVMGLFDNCGLPGTNGRVGATGSPSQTQPLQRIAAVPYMEGLALPDNVARMAGFMTGRMEVLCSGDEDQPDEAYPYEMGDVGRWGFGVVDQMLRPPEHSDYMSLCTPQWVSDHGWEIAYDGIGEIMSW